MKKPFYTSEIFSVRLHRKRNWIAMLRDLRHSVSFGIAAKITFAHDSLLASNLGKKTSTNLGAIQRIPLALSSSVCRHTV
jgi:hypothetical protein